MTTMHRALIRLFGASAGASLVLFGTRAALAFSVSNTGLKTTAEKAGLPTSETSLPVLVGTILNSVLSLVGVIFLVIIVWGGFLWMTARGNDQQVEKAKQLITSAVIGLIIIAGGYTITNFVLGAIIGATTGTVEAPAQAEAP
ncbi:MAG: pilin [Patescibacteria group bacterium]